MVRSKVVPKWLGQNSDQNDRSKVIHIRMARSKVMSKWLGQRSFQNG